VFQVSAFQHFPQEPQVHPQAGEPPLEPINQLQHGFHFSISVFQFFSF